MEKVISKLSNEELDLVVGGTDHNLSFVEGIKMAICPAGGIKDLKVGEDVVKATWKSNLGRYGVLTLLVVVPAAVTGIVEYFAISKKKGK